MFNPYAAGNKIYGGGRPHPTQGPVDPMGYKERDGNKRPVAQNAAQRKLQAMKRKNFFSADFMREGI
jgi:hypothetical protein